jgi:hypothetical protein
MNKATKNKIGSTIYERINAMNMSDAERQAALNALRDAEKIADAISWIGSKFEQLTALLHKPSLKHSLKHSLKP